LRGIKLEYFNPKSAVRGSQTVTLGFLEDMNSPLKESAVHNNKTEQEHWDNVLATLDQAAPGWRQNEEGSTSTKACAAIERLANAADDLADLHHHLTQEMGTIRFVLKMEGLPEAARKELQAHLIRLARLV
jgi:hypothetical protein